MLALLTSLSNKCLNREQIFAGGSTAKELFGCVPCWQLGAFILLFSSLDGKELEWRARSVSKAMKRRRSRRIPTSDKTFVFVNDSWKSVCLLYYGRERVGHDSESSVYWSNFSWTPRASVFSVRVLPKKNNKRVLSNDLIHYSCSENRPTATIKRHILAACIIWSVSC